MEHSETKAAYITVMGVLREHHIDAMMEATEAHRRLRLAEAMDWDDSWRYDDAFLKAWSKSEGLFKAIKLVEDMIVNLED